MKTARDLATKVRGTHNHKIAINDCGIGPVLSVAGYEAWCLRKQVARTMLPLLAGEGEEAAGASKLARALFPAADQPREPA